MRSARPHGSVTRRACHFAIGARAGLIACETASRMGSEASAAYPMASRRRPSVRQSAGDSVPSGRVSGSAIRPRITEAGCAPYFVASAASFLSDGRAHAPG